MVNGAAPGSPEMMEALVESTVSPYLVLDPDGYVVWASRHVESLFGEPPATYVGRHFLDLLHPTSQDVALSAYESFIHREPELQPGIGPPMHLDILGVDGEPVTCEVAASIGTAYGIDGVIVQVRRWRGNVLLYQAVDAIAAGEPLDDVLRRLAAVIAHDLADTAVFVAAGWDGERFETAVAAPGTPARITEFTDDLRVASKAEWAADDDLVCGFVDRAQADGYADCWTMPISVGGDDEPTAVLVLWRMVPGAPAPHLTTSPDRVGKLIGLAIESDRNRRNWQRSAMTDPLTGLANRAGLQAWLDDRVAAAAGQDVGVLFCDLDGFKRVNDDLGHDVGDVILRAVAERLRRTVRDDDLVCRWGGDEFLVICTNPDSAADLAARLIGRVNEPVAVGEATLQIGMSVGVTVAPMSSVIDDLLRASDHALRAAKGRGRNRLVVAGDGEDRSATG